MRLPWQKNASAILGNKAVADRNTRFFYKLAKGDREDPAEVAKKYAMEMFGGRGNVPLLKERERARSRFHIGLNVLPGDFSEVTKKSFLVSDVLMLTQDQEGPKVPLGTLERSIPGGTDSFGQGGSTYYSTPYGIQCHDLAGLGKWLMDAEPLLKSGLAWYLPQFVQSDTRVMGHLAPSHPLKTTPIDYDFLIRDGRAIEASGAEPITSHVTRVLFKMKVPYIEGVPLSDFSALTVSEFNSHALFKAWLRKRILELDDALEDTQSQRKIAAIEEEIRHGVAEVEAQMVRATSSKSVSTTGAVTCTTTVALLAVQHPSMLAVVTALGIAPAGLWNFLKTHSEEGKPKARESDWFYLWALMKDSERR
ncbi:hypothetical protein [Streptomyces sp. NBC_01602]|uniref:hypothetical protein n=1 Tax=Streptomyces sp. NBC_01602 TaxID=2975893 RepID=UPI003869FF7B